MNENQFGFKQNYSIEDALHHLSETIRDGIENINYCAILSIDLKKDVDTLDYNILLNKLDNIGIRVLPKVLLSSYLSKLLSCHGIHGLNGN